MVMAMLKAPLPHGSTVPNGVDALHVSRFTWIQPGERFLTEAEKARTLAQFRSVRATAKFGEGADGWLDQDVLTLCDRLNALSGVCTVQSCSGHPMTERGAPPLSGQVWLRLSEWLATLLFDSDIVQALAAQTCIYKVARVYLPHGPEVLWIVFQADTADTFLHACDSIVHALDGFSHALRGRP
jgi:hypothetical protein